MPRAPFVIRRGMCGGVEGVIGMVYSSSPATKAMFDPSEDILTSRMGALVGKAWKLFGLNLLGI